MHSIPINGVVNNPLIFVGSMDRSLIYHSKDTDYWHIVKK